MDLARVDLNLFVVFDVVYAEANLTRAAELLHVTQPAVSNALARLRDLCGDPLFVRVGRSMQPTPAARNLIGPVREALRRLQGGLEAHGQFSAPATDRVFHVAMNDVLASLVLPPLLRLVRERAPNVRLQCHEVPRRELEAELGAGTIDLALDIPQLGRGRLQALPLLEGQPYVCVLRRNHPLLRGRLTLDKYLAAPQINVSTRRRGRSFIELALGRIGRQPNVALRLPHYQPAFHVVRDSDLLLAAPR
jgi:DNA-binding transcriptional LysR family regulator